MPKTSKGAETAAAIAAALELYLGGVHDSESYRITIRRSQSDWSSKILNFRKLPRR